MKYLRTPPDIWESLSKEFNFTIDCCASDKNHLLPRYYTIDDDCLTKDWSGEIAYIHPLFDGKIGKFVEKHTTLKTLQEFFYYQLQLIQSISMIIVIIILIVK